MTERRAATTGIAAVTGASRGIGRATALELAERGYKVFALARSLDDLQDLARQGNDAGLEIVPVELDIGEAASRVRVVESIRGATDGYGLDVLINNAGYGQLGPMEEIGPDKLEQQFRVNVLGLMAFTQPWLPGMRERHRGTVVNLSSAAGRWSMPFMGAHSATKYAVEAMSDALRLELAPFGVHVVLIEPGPIGTNFGSVAEQLHEDQSASPYAQFQRRFRGSKQASDRFGRSAETVARVIARSVESAHPRPRYTVTISAKVGTVARRLVPDIAADWVLRRVLGLHAD